MVISFVSDFFQGGDGFEMGWSFTEDDSGSSSGSGSGSDTGVSTSSDASMTARAVCCSSATF